jgi:hypothetical protein
VVNKKKSTTITITTKTNEKSASLISPLIIMLQQ